LRMRVPRLWRYYMAKPVQVHGIRHEFSVNIIHGPTLGANKPELNRLQA
jgi:hypothetical protein